MFIRDQRISPFFYKLGDNLFVVLYLLISWNNNDLSFKKMADGINRDKMEFLVAKGFEYLIWFRETYISDWRFDIIFSITFENIDEFIKFDCVSQTGLLIGWEVVLNLGICKVS